MTPVTVAAGDVVAAGSGATGWNARALFEVSGNLYAVTQDSALHVWKSINNGASWSEQDASDAPSVSNSAYPFSAMYWPDDGLIYVARFTATNTTQPITFNPATDQWGSNAGAAATDADNLSPLRLSWGRGGSTWGSTGVPVTYYTSSSDDADIRFRGGSIATFVVNGSSAERSIVGDAVWPQNSTSNSYVFWYDTSNDDFSVLSMVGNGASFTGSSVVDLDGTMATTEDGHAPSTFGTYLVSGVTTVTAAYIDADNTINERECSLDVPSASIGLGTQRQVTSGTSYAGGKLSTCKYDGDRYVFASNASGTSIDYWVFSGGSWSSGGNVATGSGLHLAQALPVDGVGILVCYQSGSNVVVDWAVDGPGGGAVNDSGTVSVGTIAASGQAVTGTATTTVNATGTIAVGTISATGQAITGAAGVSVAATITPSTITASGQAVSGGYGVSDVATVALGTVAATGQSIAATFDVSVTGAVSAGTVAATGEVIVGTFGQSVVATVAVGAVVATGESVNASTGISLTATVSVGAVAATGESIAAALGVSDTATVNVGSAAATGGTVTASAGGSVVGSVNVGTIVAAGEAVSASTTASAAASIAPGTADATGQSVNATAGGSVVAVVQNGTAIASGVLVTATATISAFGSVSAATNAATGYLITAGSGASVVIDPATLDATGYLVNAYIGGRPPTVFGPLLTATVSAEAVLTGSMSADRLLAATISAQPVLTARLRVNE